MSQRAVQTLLQSTLQGFQTPAMATANIGPLNCYIAPPQALQATLEAPSVFLWGAHAVGERTTAPASHSHVGGFKRLPWKVDLWVMFIGDAAPDDVVLPLIIDAIRWAIERIPYPQTITDLDSEPQQTQLVAIGERIELHEENPVSIDDQSNLLYTAHLVVTVFEDYQA